MHRALEALLGPIGAQPGCRRCTLMYDAGHADAVTLLAG